jgi:hypothetical protein
MYFYYTSCISELLHDYVDYVVSRFCLYEFINHCGS